jgi:hypothetical protein
LLVALSAFLVLAMSTQPFVPKGTVLKDPRTGTELDASELTRDSPALVIILRRPGCLICRDQAIAIWESRETLQKVCQGGASKKEVRLVCIVHEWKDREIEAFTKDYWKGELYWDESKAFYKAVHGGEVKRGSLLSLLNPWSKAYKNIRDAKSAGRVKEQNFEGDGLTLGGLVILDCPDGNAVYQFAEKAFGDRANLETIAKEVRNLYTAQQ